MDKEETFLCLICSVFFIIVIQGCGVSYHYTNMDYISKSKNYYCQENKFKINKVEDSRNIGPGTWYATVRGGFNNPLIELHSVKSVADDIDSMIKKALFVRGCETNSVVDYILFPTVYALSGNVNSFDKEFIFRLSYVMKTTDGSVIYKDDINLKKTKEEWSSGLWTNIEDFKWAIDGVVSDGIDEMLDNQKLWNAARDYRSDKQQLTIKNKSGNRLSISEELKTLSELKKSGMITDEEYQKAKEILLKTAH